MVELHPSKVDVEGSSPFSRFLIQKIGDPHMKHYVYILQSEKNKRYYVGVTNNVERRIGEHNLGKVKSTAPYKPWSLKRKEEYPDINTAYKRERFIKAKHSRRIIETIIMSGK